MQYFGIGVQVTNEEIVDKQLYMYMDLSSLLIPRADISYHVKYRKLQLANAVIIKQ